ncbi:SGNH/GDSL hydrolase family protein [Ornithinibacillus salinisoli]|uniref:SGNH/GDSL hydrolase family protein n=1 Tax=Ornithinibacillus salinisoli TaxID=1848459 RepID=A0ABW4VXM4_9BACI
MKRKMFIYIISLLLLCFGVATFIIFEQSNATNNITMPNVTNEDEQENDEENAENDSDENQVEENEENGTENFKDIISEAVESTIDFFKRKETNIVAIGDSLTQGVGDRTDRGGYVGIIEEQLNATDERVHFDNFGKRGNRTDQLITRLNDASIVDAIKKSDIVLITIGANDIMQVAKENFTNLTFEPFSKELVHYEERVKTILERIHEINSNTEIYLIGFYNPFSQYFPEIEELDQIVDSWNATGQRLVEEHSNGTFIPTKDLFVGTEVNLFADDNFHPNEEGYELMAERVLEYLTEER